ncbi:MAG TPA: urate hydroxylase PuuD [Candidatus Lustribacter sp.]|nr:urate hydroxylase PuuD [Candidatus Lustribacter sp.]
MQAYVIDWLSLIVRWFHLTAGIAWIGTSFYFVWLDDNLNRAVSDAERKRGIDGELWGVHGGGFYHNEKYLTGPTGEPLSNDLHWFYWEAYSTWLSGMAMLAVVYWAGASSFMIDPSVLNLTPPEAIGISIASIVVGWLVYDALCRLLGKNEVALWTAIGLFLLFADWGLFHIFGPRAAFIHVGAIVGTIMVWNVFFIIIPGQRKVVAQLRAGEVPDSRPGELARQRSVQNTYFTLPVLFIMISNHYPMTYSGPYGWLVLAGLAIAGVLVRRFYVLTHFKKIVIALPVAAIVVLAIVAWAIAPRTTPAAANAAAPAFAQVAPIVAERCGVCHAAHPTEAGFSIAPAGVLLDTPERIVADAALIRAEAVASHAMPLGNLTHMTDAERATLGAWIDAGAKGP